MTADITKIRLRQVWTIARIELSRAFFSKRALWVYILAGIPALIFGYHAVNLTIREHRYSGRGVTPAQTLATIPKGASVEEALRIAPNPVDENRWHSRRFKVGKKEHAPRAEGSEQVDENRDEERDREDVEARLLTYYDGTQLTVLRFENGKLQGSRSHQFKDFPQDRLVYAGIFQFFYLRLAVFFGCLGIFMNLFRGEMLDKTLHYWFLTPVRREVLLAGKYLAGLIAAVVIFGGGAVLSYAAMLWPQNGVELQAFWAAAGLNHMVWYTAAAMLGCLGYGSVFLASGLLLRNPIVPAVVILVWESVNGFLPALLQKLSVLYYLQSICPEAAPVDNGAPALIRLLLAPAAPASHLVAVLGLLAVTALVLWAASRAVLRVEIDYGTE